jgi:hypothetical protein
MTFRTYLIEFYRYPDYVHAEYDETSAESLEDAVAELKKYHPEAEILNTYIHTACLNGL